MHSKFALLAALSVGLLPVAALAQDAPVAPAAPAAAAPAAPAAVVPAAPDSPDAAAAATPAAAPAMPVHAAPQAYPAKIALIAFQQAVVSTNEGQQTMAGIRAKYEPKQTELVALNAEIDKEKKALQAAPATTTDAERSAKMKTLDSKEKQLDEKTQEARTAYNADLQAAYGKVAEKMHKTLLDYVQKNGYTILFDVSNEQSSVVWTQESPSADITLAVIDAYNAVSGVAAPAASAAVKPKAESAAPRATAKPATK